MGQLGIHIAPDIEGRESWKKDFLTYGKDLSSTFKMLQLKGQEFIN